MENIQKILFREITFLAIFEIAKNGFWSKKFFREIDLFDFTSFLAWTFLNFPAYFDILYFQFHEKTF